MIKQYQILSEKQPEKFSFWQAVFQTFSVAGYNFRQWRRNPRIFMTFSLALILCYLLSAKVVEFSREYETMLQVLEPFIWTFGDSSSILLASLLLLFLFSDMPFLSSGTPFYLMRIDRKIWLIGQAVYIVCATFLYLLFVLAVTSLVCMENAFPGNQWSDTAAMLGYSGAGEAILLPSSVKTMEMTTPWHCAAVIFGLMLLYALVLVFLMLLFNMWKGQAAGVAAAAIFTVYGFLLEPSTIAAVLQLPASMQYRAYAAAGWLSPLNHATYPIHNFGYDMYPELWQTGVVFGILILICFLLSLRVVRNYSFCFTGTEEE